MNIWRRIWLTLYETFRYWHAPHTRIAMRGAARNYIKTRSLK